MMFELEPLQTMSQLMEDPVIEPLASITTLFASSPSLAFVPAPPLSGELVLLQASKVSKNKI